MQEAYNGIYYCDKDGKTVDDVAEINGNKYLFSDGWMCSAGYTQIDGENYVVGAEESWFNFLIKAGTKLVKTGIMWMKLVRW